MNNKFIILNCNLVFILKYQIKFIRNNVNQNLKKMMNELKIKL